MDNLESLLRRNEEFASDGFDPNLKMMPSGRSLIIGCVDPRADPAKIFKLEQGEAAILRNIGGRVNPALIESLELLQEVTKGAGRVGPGANLIVLHHTDCGIHHCYHRAPGLLARHLGLASGQIDDLAVTDPYQAVALDVEALRASPQVPGGYVVSGLVYDVVTGKVDVVVPPARLRPEGA